MKNCEIVMILLIASLLGGVKQAQAFPVNPSKVPVEGVRLDRLENNYTLAYDSENKKIVYYQPKVGRIALVNGMPLIGFGILRDGRGVLNAQFEFVVSPGDRAQLIKSIRSAGYEAVPFPFKSTTVKPLFQGWNPETGTRNCPEVVDLSTGTKKIECDITIFESVTYLKNGPVLGENIAISSMLTPNGAFIFKAQLQGGGAIQVGLDAEYYSAGTAFTALVEVDYEKLYRSASAYAGFHGFITDINVEAFWKQEGLCYGKNPEDCSVKVRFWNDRGREINNLAVDPDSTDGKAILQAIDQLKYKLQDEMLQPITPVLGKADNSGGFGYKLNAKFQNISLKKKAQFEFKSTRGINIEKTNITATAACIRIDDSGAVSRETSGECSRYWAGTLGINDLMKSRGSK